MANNYLDSTGVLLFDGPAVVTPVIRMLFAPFKLDDDPEGNGSRQYVAVLSEDNDYDWDSYAGLLASAAHTELGIDLRDLVTPADVVKTVAKHFAAEVDSLIDAIDFDNQVAIGDVVALALALRDGHNLAGHCMEGAYHCSRPRLWEFGGWASFGSRRYALNLSTSSLLQFAREFDEALDKGADQAAIVLATMVGDLTIHVADERIRGEVVNRLGSALGYTDTGASSAGTEAPAPAEAAWTRTVYVEARPCDDFGEGPGFARWDVTPAFIAQVLSLQALCVERKLTEVRVTGGPDVWGPVNVADELRLTMPELVVTPSMFWFSDQPKHRNYAVETRGQSIDSFLRDVSGAGEPVYLDIDPSEIEDENAASD